MNLPQKIEDIFSRYKVQVAYLFGSCVSGHTGPLSDVDIAILFDFSEKPEERFSKRLLLLHEIMSALRTSQVDLVVLNEASPAISFNVIRQGQVIFCQDESLRVKFESGALRDYIDMGPLRRTYNQALFENIAEGPLK